MPVCSYLHTPWSAVHALQPRKLKPSEMGDLPAQIQYRASFGPADSEGAWGRATTEVCMLAETYENQRYLPLKGWSDAVLPTDPPRWSDRLMKHKQPRDGVFLNLFVGVVRGGGRVVWTGSWGGAWAGVIGRRAPPPPPPSPSCLPEHALTEPGVRRGAVRRGLGVEG